MGRVDRVVRREEEDCGRKMWRWDRDVWIMFVMVVVERANGFSLMEVRMLLVMTSRRRSKEKLLPRSNRMTAELLPPRDVPS